MSKSKNYRKYSVTTMAAAAVAVATVAPVVSADSAGFPDVSPSDSHYEGITALAAQGVIQGKADGNFDQWGNVTRGQVAVMFAKALNLETPSDLEGALAGYSDVNVGSEYDKYIAAVTEAGIFKGAHGTFDTNKPISRQQMATVLVKGFNLQNFDKGDDKYVDLSDADASHAGNIQVLRNLDITTVSDFRAKSPITRGAFATMLHKTMNYSVQAQATVKAINNTTVEVRFEDAIRDIKALDFAIGGLEVTNAVVKQTENNVAVLTTEPQEGGKEYTVTESGDTLGSFTGISAVIPSAIDITSNSTQAIVGEEVTVSAQVEVEDGANKEGIPVTFNIITHRGGLNSGAAYEVYTDADGVATYTYTQYYGGQDTIVAYPTGAPATRSTEGIVYWGVKEQLVLTEVTEGNDLVNGQKKVYKIVARTEDGGAYTGRPVNIAFEENINVPQDQGVTGVTVTDASGADYPYQYTTGGSSNFAQTQVLLDSNGEATFTLTGADASVTPIAFIDGTWEATGPKNDSWNGKLDATELQVKAPTVSFEATQEIAVEVESIGTQNAAAINAQIEGESAYGVGNGGRDYRAVIRDTDGQLAPKGTKVLVTVTKDDLGNKDGDVSALDSEGDLLGTFNGENSFELTVGDNGEVEFTLIGANKTYATPTVYHDNGDEPNELDPADAQGKGEIVYFGDAVLKTSKITVTDQFGDPVDSVKAGTTAHFHYQVTDQNGKENNAPSAQHEATFQVKNQSFTNSIFVDGKEIKARQTESIKKQANNGNAELVVTSNGPAEAIVDVSSSQYTLTDGAASVKFTEANILEEGKNYTGTVTKIDKDKKTVTLNIDGHEHELSYRNADRFEDGNPKSENEFEDLVEVGSKITYIKGDRDSFDVHVDKVPGTGNVTAEVRNALNNATSEEEVEDILKGLAIYNALSDAGKTTALNDVWAQVQGGGYNTNLEVIDDIDIEFQATAAEYSIGTAADAGEAATAELTDVIALEASAAGEAFNGIKVTFEKGDATDSSYDAATKTLTVTVESTKVTDPVTGDESYTTVLGSYADVEGVLQSATLADGTTELFSNDPGKVVLDGALAGAAELLIDETLTLSGGENATAQVPETITVTFSEAVTLGAVAVDLDGTNVAAGVTATYAEDANGDDIENVVILTFTTEDAHKDADEITALTNITVAGKSLGNLPVNIQ